MAKKWGGQCPPGPPGFDATEYSNKGNEMLGSCQGLPGILVVGDSPEKDLITPFKLSLIRETLI